MISLQEAANTERAVLLQHLFPGESEMALRMRSFDWSKTAVGPIETWPQSLKTSLSICLSSRFPMFVWWGRDLTVFYNDAYIPFLGSAKHPHHLGHPAREQWAEIWETLHPLTEEVLNKGTASWAESMQLFMTRKGFLEETYFTFSYSPVRDETGAVGGIINPCQETTESIIGERRLKTLHHLSAENMKTISEVGQSTAFILSKNNHDVPFALIYLKDANLKQATLIGASGVKIGSRIAPEILSLEPSSQKSWPLLAINQCQRPRKIDKLRSLFQSDLPTTPYEEGPDDAYLLPINLVGEEEPVGFVILGISSRLEFDDRYREFLSLVSKHISTQISNVDANEKLETRVQERTAELERSNKELEQVTGVAAHDLRAPINSMRNWVDILDVLVPKPRSDEIDQAIEFIKLNTKRAATLIGDLLQIARINTDSIRIEKVDLQKTIDNLFMIFKQDIDEAGAKIDCVPLPQVWGNQTHLESLFSNLIRNALIYRDKSRTPQISIGFHEKMDFYEFFIKDNGIGIDPQYADRIFEMFKRLHDENAYPGTGIGLAYCKKVVELSGGKIWVDSIPDVGSTFFFTYPRNRRTKI